MHVTLRIQLSHIVSGLDALAACMQEGHDAAFLLGATIVMSAHT